MEIKILGGGCANCIALYNAAKQSCEDLGIEAALTKVEDFEKISEYNVMSTPALVIDETVVGYGKLNYKKVKKIIEKNAK